MAMLHSIRVDLCLTKPQSQHEPAPHHMDRLKSSTPAQTTRTRSNTLLPHQRHSFPRQRISSGTISNHLIHLRPRRLRFLLIGLTRTPPGRQNNFPRTLQHGIFRRALAFYPRMFRCILGREARPRIDIQQFRQ